MFADETLTKIQYIKILQEPVKIDPIKPELSLKGEQQKIEPQEDISTSSTIADSSVITLLYPNGIDAKGEIKFIKNQANTEPTSKNH